MKTLSADQLAAFLREAKESGVFEFYYIELATGLRRGDLLGLKWSDIDFNQGVLHIRRQIARINGEVVEAPLKTESSYCTLPIGADAVGILLAQNGVDIKTVSGMLGHYSAGFTLDTYAHITTTAQKQAAQTMDNLLSSAV